MKSRFDRQNRIRKFLSELKTIFTKVLFVLPIFIVLYLEPFPQEILNYEEDFSILMDDKTYCFAPDATPKCEAISINSFKDKINLLRYFQIPPEIFDYEYCVSNIINTPFEVERDIIEVQISSNVTVKGNETKCFPLDFSKHEFIVPQFLLYQCNENARPRGLIKSLNGNANIKITAKPKYQFILPLLITLAISSLWWGWILLIKKVWNELLRNKLDSN